MTPHECSQRLEKYSWVPFTTHDEQSKYSTTFSSPRDLIRLAHFGSVTSNDAILSRERERDSKFCQPKQPNDVLRVRILSSGLVRSLPSMQRCQLSN